MPRKRTPTAPPVPRLPAEVAAYLRALPADEREELRAFSEQGVQPKSPARLRATIGAFVLLTLARRGAFTINAAERIRRFAAVDAALEGKTPGDVIEEALDA